MNSLDGVRLFVSPHLPDHPDKYVPPNHAFVEYEPSDFKWLEYFGFGHRELDKTKNFVLKTPWGLAMSTATYYKVKAATAGDKFVIKGDFV